MRRILIVGSNSGVGQSLADKLSIADELWTVSRHTVQGNNGRHIVWDATDAEFPIDLLPETLHGLVYCPGSIRLLPFGRLTDQAFQADFELNLLGAVRVLRAALPALSAATSASVVLFSTVAVSIGMPMHTSIAAAKGAVEGLTRSLAAELAPKIRCNAIAPSLTDTPLSAGLLRTDRQRISAAERHPLQRLGQAAEIAEAARFLLSEESGWMTGQILHIDGGLSSVRRFS
jgi:NAD(P)-dependent dehydrogenase (short-subunit alcohol dehydrogenase family)